MNLDFSDWNCIGSENEIENYIDVVFHSILPYPTVATVNYLIVEFFFQYAIFLSADTFEFLFKSASFSFIFDMF